MESQQIDSDEIILHRVPPDVGGVKFAIVRDGRQTATSFAFQLRANETDISCSRLKQTSPRQLLDDLKNDDISPEGWRVCWLRVSEIRELRIDVVHEPTKRDPGHCEIRPTKDQTISKTIRSKIAKRSLLLSEDDVKSLREGDTISA